MTLASRITYRLTEKYETKITDLVQALCEEVDYNYNKDDLVKSLHQLFDSEFFICASAYLDDLMIGTIGFIVYPEMYNRKMVTAVERFWYVEPDFRRGVGMSLVKYIEKHLKVSRIEFGVSNPKLQQLLELNGYYNRQSIMTKEF